MREDWGKMSRHSSAKKGKKKQKEVMVKDVAVAAIVDIDEQIRKEERRRKKLIKRAKSQAKLFAELGLDENGNPFDNFSLLKYPVREWILTLPGLHDPIALNPVVSMLAIVSLWGLVLWTAVQPAVAKNTLVALRTNVSLTSGWVFQGTKSILFFFILFVCYKYGHLHMRSYKKKAPSEKPEYSNFSYFAMIFAVGVGVGLAIYCVPETLWHQAGDHFYAKAGYRSQDERSLFAINMTVTNWAITSWIHYTVVVICMSLAHHVFGLPLTFRSCFYPILGHYTWGWIGDVVDGLTIVVSIAGICTNLGLSCEQLSSGLLYLGWIEERRGTEAAQEQITNIQITAVWVVTAASCMAIASGLYSGVRIVSVAAVCLALALGCLVTLIDDTAFLLNLVVQETGYFLQTSLLQLNFWTDAFGQLRPGSGRAIDGRASEQWWMDAWMIFYQAWVITWAPSIGVFFASISRGRTVRELVLYSFALPVGACLVWFTAWGGIALRQSRQGMELQTLGELHYNNSRHFLADGSDLCYDVPQNDVVLNDETIFTNYLSGVSPVCLFDPTTSSQSIFRVLYSFGGLGPTLSFIFLIVCALYFVPSYGAATLVVDGWASNGRKNQHWARRMFWASTVGTLTSVLLSAGGAEALYAVQAATIVGGLPFAILLCYLTQSIVLFCRAADERSQNGQRSDEDDYKFSDQPEFEMPIYGGIFNVIEYVASLGKANEVRAKLGIHQASSLHIVEFVKGLLVPFSSLNQVLAASYPENPRTNMVTVLFYTALYLGWIILAVVSMTRDKALSGVACTMFVVAGVVIGMTRAGFRNKHNLRSNVVADLIAGIFFWPQVLAQMRLHCMAMSKSKNETRTENDLIIVKGEEFGV